MERLNKYLARAGVASRRRADLLIQTGRVKVNGSIVKELGVRIDPGNDLIEVDGRQVVEGNQFEYLILNKPAGYLSTVRDPFGRPTVIDLLPPNLPRLYPVGRLDFDTTGLLFFTNDGDLALVLTHPRHLVEKVYQVKVAGAPKDSELKKLERGIILEDGPTAPAKIAIDRIENGNAILIMTIREGRKRQVKRMLKAIGYPVLALHRLAMGPLTLGNLKPGECRRPSESELRELLKLKEQFSPGSVKPV
ncbi:MAG: rRNA pseudouridine synthase [Firmicutes bacterium]|nr:rRNA pseudouridine synthase [Bacillota bacterium]